MISSDVAMFHVRKNVGGPSSGSDCVLGAGCPFTNNGQVPH